MEAVTRYLNIAYLALCVGLVWLGAKTTAMIFDMVGPRADRILFGDFRFSTMIGAAIGIAITVYLWRAPKVYQWATEVTVELSKVTWPERPETQRSTYVVIVFAILISLFLAAMDFFWKFATDLIL